MAKHYKTVALRARNTRKNKTAQAVRQIKKTLRQYKPEPKYGDLNVVGQTFNWSPTSSYVQNVTSGMSQGDTDYNNYTGDSIFMKRLKIRGQFYNVTGKYQTLRVVLVCVKNNMEGLITTSNIGNLVMESAYSTTANALNAPLDNDNRHGVSVLYDKKFTINTQLTTATSAYNSMPFYMNLKINRQIQFQSGGIVPTKNGLYLFFIADEASTGYLNYLARYTYTDV